MIEGSLPTGNDRQLRRRSASEPSSHDRRDVSLSLEDLMLLTVELWVVGLLVYHLGLSALGID
jgi:hypothetical protein